MDRSSTPLRAISSPDGSEPTSSPAVFPSASQRTPRPSLRRSVSLRHTFAAAAASSSATGSPARSPHVPDFKDHDPSARIDLESMKRGKKRAYSYCVGVDGTLLKTLRATVSKKKRRFKRDDFDLDLTYITPRIIAMGFPSAGREGLYRNPMPEVQRFMETLHPGRYRIYNLCSEREYNPSDFLGRVVRFPFDDHNPCPLEMIPRFCADVDAWLGLHPENIIAVHCKAGKGRTGLMISAYLLHAGIRGSAEGALSYFGVKRTANGRGVTIPSQMRYVWYYAQMCISGPPLTHTYRLTHVRMRGTPAVDIGGSCAPYFEIRVAGAKVFDWKRAVKAKHAAEVAAGGGGHPSGGKLRRYRRGEAFIDFDLSAENVLLRGDVKFNFLAEPSLASKPTKLCHLWIHTAFVTRNYLLFGRNVIDGANKDKRGIFPSNFALEFLLTRVPIIPDVDAIAEACAAPLEGVPSSGGGTAEAMSSAMSTLRKQISNASSRTVAAVLSPSSSSSAAARNRPRSMDARTSAEPQLRMRSVTEGAGSGHGSE